MTDEKSQRWYRLYASAAAELDRKRLSAWMWLKPQFTVVFGICTAIVITMKSVS
jgi:hypothetical protein